MTNKFSLKLIISIISIGFIIISSSSCEKLESNTALENEPNANRNQFLEIKKESGIYHNEFLDSSLIYLQENQILSNPNEKTFTLLANYAESFFIRRGFNEKEVTSQVETVAARHIIVGNNKSTYDNDMSEIQSFVITETKGYLVDSPDYEFFEEEMNQFFDNCINSDIYSSTEKEEIALCIGVAISSYEYWSVNVDSWNISTTNKSIMKDDKTKKEKIVELALADLSGFGVAGVPGMAIASGLVAWSWD